jgi:hypothetical protein
MKKTNIAAGLLVLTALGAVGCAKIKVERAPVEGVVDLSGKWNDTDSRLVAEAMVNDCLGRPWATDFARTHDAVPAVIVGTVFNKTSEHIDAATFVADLERSLLNSGKAKVVAAKEPREEIRDEREDQQMFSSPETAKAFRKETGADYMLQGGITSIKDEIKGKYVIFYQTDLELIDLETNEKVWMAQKEIKKIVTRSAFGL